MAVSLSTSRKPIFFVVDEIVPVYSTDLPDRVEDAVDPAFATLRGYCIRRSIYEITPVGNPILISCTTASKTAKDFFWPKDQDHDPFAPRLSVTVCGDLDLD